MIRSRPNRRQTSSETHWARRLEMQRERRRMMRIALVLLIGVPVFLMGIMLLVRAGLLRRLEEHERLQQLSRTNAPVTPDWRSLLPVPPTSPPPVETP